VRLQTDRQTDAHLSRENQAFHAAASLEPRPLQLLRLALKPSQLPRTCAGNICDHDRGLALQRHTQRMAAKICPPPIWQPSSAGRKSARPLQKGTG
jgi:hypothetical protein